MRSLIVKAEHKREMMMTKLGGFGFAVGHAI
jgi:hypothetical protein